ncbi:MAG: hypothetical protein V4480_00340 [Patescibacteria group bacterium]
MDSTEPTVVNKITYEPMRFLLMIAIVALLIFIATLIPALNSLHGIVSYLLIVLLLIVGHIIADKVYYLIK